MASRRRKSGLLPLVAFLASAALLVCWWANDWRLDFGWWSGLEDDDSSSKVLVTAYCNCGKCCGWEYGDSGDGEPVYNYGKLKGKPKKIGITARGTVAAHGTVAADLSVYKFGTRLEIPGYGTGTVEDIGGKIKGRHIDVWFPSHEEALRWGARRLEVKVLDDPPAKEKKRARRKRGR